jgi:hypothetical protein
VGARFEENERAESIAALVVDAPNGAVVSSRSCPHCGRSIFARWSYPHTAYALNVAWCHKCVGA